MELWNTSKVVRYSDFSKFNTTHPLYSRRVLRDTITFKKEDYEYSAKSHGKFTGFFVPPHTGAYTFLIKNDDVGKLYMSEGQSAANKVSVVS